MIFRNSFFGKWLDRAIGSVPLQKNTFGKTKVFPNPCCETERTSCCPETGCCIADYMTGWAELGFALNVDTWDLTYGDPTLTSTLILNKLDWQWKFFQGGIMVDSDSGSLTTPVNIPMPYVVNIPTAGAGVYWMKSQYEDARNRPFNVQKLIEVDGDGNIVKSIATIGIVKQGVSKCRDISLVAGYVGDEGITVLQSYWLLENSMDLTILDTNALSINTILPDSETPNELGISFGLDLDMTQWPDVDFAELDVDGINSSIRVEVTCNPSAISLVEWQEPFITYNCATNVLSGRISNGGIGGDLMLQISPNGNDNWVDIELLSIAPGNTDFEVTTVIANGSWWFRVRNIEDTFGSNVQNVIINCP